MTHTLVRSDIGGVPATAQSGGMPPGAAIPGPQKAAIIIQMILSEGGSLPLSKLSARGQARLMQDFVEIGRVDRATLALVVADLERDLSTTGISFPGSVAGAISTLENHLNPDVVSNLRQELGLGEKPQPWAQIIALPPEKLIALIPDEDPKIAAIVLSKLDPEKASEILDRMDDAQTNAVALAMQNTETVSPDLVAKIGKILTDALPKDAPKAFSDAPALRLANLLNAATPGKRDSVLASLGDQDAEFAANVRGLIFTFADIASRIAPEDVAKIIRDVSQDILVTALAYASGDDPASADFLLANLSQRMAASIREEMAEQKDIATKAGEAAMGKITSAIRNLSDAGEITIRPATAADDAAQSAA